MTIGILTGAIVLGSRNSAEQMNTELEGLEGCLTEAVKCKGNKYEDYDKEGGKYKVVCDSKNFLIKGELSSYLNRGNYRVSCDEREKGRTVWISYGDWDRDLRRKRWIYPEDVKFSGLEDFRTVMEITRYDGSKVKEHLRRECAKDEQSLDRKYKCEVDKEVYINNNPVVYKNSYYLERNVVMRYLEKMDLRILVHLRREEWKVYFGVIKSSKEPDWDE